MDKKNDSVEVLAEIMQLVDTACQRQLLTQEERRQIGLLLEAAQARQRLADMSRRVNNS